MSFLDLYTGDQAQQMRPKANEGRDLPATFGESFHAAWDNGRLFDQSVAGETARQDAITDYIDEVRQKTGKDPAASVDWTINAPGVGYVPLPSAMLLDRVNAAVGKINEGLPSDQAVPALSPDDLDQRAVAKSRAAGKALADIEGREHSGLGTFLGSAASAATDPINILALPIAPETASVGLVGAALRWGGVAALSQVGIEAVGGAYREQVQPGYAQSGAPTINVLEAAAGGAFLGGATRALGNAWTRVKTGAWPTSIKDAGNVLESEANVANANVYAGAEGEAAHRDALASAIDNILNEKPVDVSHIVTPEIEAGSRNIVARLSAERAAPLPAFDRRSVELLSEEAGLRARNTDLAGQSERLPEGDAAAADRLNRLQAVEQQMQGAEGAERKRLVTRRDELLTDTTPEQLQAAAAPITQRQQIEAERGRIANRLAEIEAERTQARAAALGAQPASIGQMQPARPFPSMEELRQLAQSTGDLAAQDRVAAGAAAAPELPFHAGAAEAQARQSADALAEGVAQIAQRAGYDMPKDEAAKVADALVRMSPEEAQDALRSLQVSPRQSEAIIGHPAPFPEPREAPATDPQALKTMLDSSEHEAALQADIDRERVGDVKREIPVGVDERGNPVFRSLDDLSNEAESYRKAAEQLQACANPAAEGEGA